MAARPTRHHSLASLTSANSDLARGGAVIHSQYGRAMRATLVMVLGLSACGFSGSSGEGTADGPLGDGSSGSDGPASCAPGFVDLCGEPAGSDSLIITSGTTINTGQDVRCRVKNQAGGPPICALFFKRLEIQAGAVLRFVGPRPVAVSASEEIVITGVLDVSSRRNDGPSDQAAGNQTACTFARAAEEDVGGAAGGAGGTFATKGGDGGDGDRDNNGADDDTALGGRPGEILALGALRGGCAGQAGAYNSMATRGLPGRGGGAVYLTAPKIAITGAVKAAGAGGSGGGTDAAGGGGGGGGGSGGLIVIESPLVDVSGATLFATGGGGGQGGDANSNGEDAADADSTTVAAPGGDAGGNGGNGGNGALTGDGEAGDSDNSGGGGGGGGVGYIRIFSKSAKQDRAKVAPDVQVVAR